MTLIDPNFIRFDGTPVTGRAPAQLRVDGQMTGEQFDAVKYAYQKFREAVRLSIIDLTIKHVELTDGTRIRMESRQGRDVVYVWPAPSVPLRAWVLPHGLVVDTGWSPVTIYKWGIVGDPATVTEKTWSIDGCSVPQAAKGIASYNSAWPIAKEWLKPSKLNAPQWPEPSGTQILGGIPLPMVAATEGGLWDYVQHSAKTNYGDVVPFNLKYPDPVSGERILNAHGTHLATMNEIRALNGDLLFGPVPPPPAILVPSLDAFEEIRFMPLVTSGDGERAVMHTSRKAELTATTFFVYKSDALIRNAKAAYSVLNTVSVNFTAPINVTSTTVQDVTEFGHQLANPNGADVVWAILYHWGGTRGAPNPTGVPYLIYGTTREVRSNNTGYATPGGAMFATHLNTAQDPRVITGIARLPRDVVDAPSVIDSISLTFSMYVPRVHYWRGGEVTYGMSVPIADAGVGRLQTRLHRSDISVSDSGGPKITIGLGWANIDLVDGVVECTTSGAYWWDSYAEGRLGVGVALDTVLGQSTSMVDGIPPWGQLYGNGLKTGEEYWADLMEWASGRHDFKPQCLADLATMPNSLDYDRFTTTILKDEAATNRCGYDLNSRYIIDYDHRSRMCVMLRFRIKCDGAQWDQNPAPNAIRGQMILTSDPTYTLEVWVDFVAYAEQGGTDALAEVRGTKRLMVTTFTKPGYEFPEVEAPLSPYFYPAGDTFTYHIAPQIKVPKEFMTMIPELTRHQGVNPHMAARDAVLKNISQRGIEYSSLEETDTELLETPHMRPVGGHLYARTFTVSQFLESLWMLEALTIDAPRYNNRNIEGAEFYYYCPAFRDFIYNQKIHIEIRNGQFVQWSDEFQPPNGVVRPAPEDRNIKLYSV